MFTPVWPSKFKAPPDVVTVEAAVPAILNAPPVASTSKVTPARVNAPVEVVKFDAASESRLIPVASTSNVPCASMSTLPASTSRTAAASALASIRIATPDV